MRNSLSRVVLGLAVVGGLATVLIIPSYAQVPGTLERPGMSEARVWINNRKLDEAIPVTLIGGDVRVPIPVAVMGGTVAVTGKVDAIATAARQTWEYRVVSAAEPDVQAAIAGLGNDGWEAVGLTAQPGAKMSVLLKRPR